MRSKTLKAFLIVLLLIIVGVAVSLWLFVRKGISAHDEPTAVEAYIARTLRSWAMPADADELKNPRAPNQENVRSGMEHFADHCAVCHANNGSGDTQFGRGMYPKPPDLRAAQTQDLTDGEIYYIIQNGVRLTGMPAFGSGRPDDLSTWDLVLFIRHLPKLTPEEEAQMKYLNPKGPEEWNELQELEEFLLGGEPGGSERLP